MCDIKSILDANRVVPVVVLERREDTVPLCEAILEGGLNVVEITLRTGAALDAIAEAVKRFPDLAVGAGTVIDEDQVRQVADCGATFGVSPGATPALLDAVRRHDLPFLPGGATVSEFMANAAAGFSVQKFFPAEPSGGRGYLNGLASPLPNLSFCPTGGVNARNARDYLALPNVAAVGGSWFVDAGRIAAGEWEAIRDDVRRLIDGLKAPAA